MAKQHEPDNDAAWRLGWEQLADFILCAYVIPDEAIYITEDRNDGVQKTQTAAGSE
jgi:hypothetical protein